MLRRPLLFALPCLIAATCFMTAGCETAPQGPARSDGMFVHIHSGPDEPHRVLMGLRMAQMMAADRDVLVYFDIDGVQTVLQSAPDLQMQPFGSSRSIIRDLAERGVPLYACPGCLEAAGASADQLLPGVQVAEKQGFFGFTAGRIITLDY
jgi:predicted peroxiredoxin